MYSVFSLFTAAILPNLLVRAFALLCSSCLEQSEQLPGCR